MTVSLAFAPHVPLLLLWIAGAVGLAIVAYGFITRARGTWARLLAFAAIGFVLANPLIVHETREPLPDVAALILDRSQSMDIEDRNSEAGKAFEVLKAKLAKQPHLELRTATVTTSTSGDDNGTRAFSVINSTLADVPPERIAGTILLTDGEVHDAPDSAHALKYPLHALIAGRRDERDRKLSIISATRFGIVGQGADIVARVDDFGAAGDGFANVTVRIDGKDAGTRTIPTGKPAAIKVPIAHGGENVVELAVQPGPNELTLENNRAVVTVNGVRDRLRVVLISGEPHAGERVWRSLLKSDPSVDLVHFTILRSPDSSTDFTPITELALIAFPTQELFETKLYGFDLIIFDRYTQRGGERVMPLGYFENIARYVENGGALLVSSGPEYAGPQSVSHTPLAAVLPAQPTGQVVTEPYKPMVTPQGFAHPVTQNLPGANTPTSPPTWGRWFRLIGANKISGQTLMSGPNNQPLLVLDHVQKGRVAELLSDHVWLWARGYEGGGPEAELLRRLAHWLMKEPELEEERLTANVTNGQIVVERRTMGDSVPPVAVTAPSGKTSTMTLTKTTPGVWKAQARAAELGLYRFSNGTLSTVAASGPLNPREVADMRATDSILSPVAQASGGSVKWLGDGIPDIRRVGPDAIASGSGWIGLRANGAYRVTSVEQQPLLPAWLALVLVLGTLLLAWRMEGR
ncbi:MAG TPA: hypothetical protein VGG10_19245 [Rhizomicrobium sp.]|jgi:hypothetical protein